MVPGTLHFQALVPLLGCSLAGAGSIFYNGYQQPYLNYAPASHYGNYAPASPGYYGNYGNYGYNALAYQGSAPAYQGSIYPSIAPVAPVASVAPVAPVAPYSTASQV